MKNKNKILSLIACLSLLSSCNKSVDPSSSCSVTTSTPTSTVTPSVTKTVEELNNELFENYANVNSSGSLISFKDNIPEEYLNLETIIIPEEISTRKIYTIDSKSGGTFSQFTNVRTIIIPPTINNIFFSTNSASSSSPFNNLPKLENIKVDGNDWYYSKGNCLIEREWTGSTFENRQPNGELALVCGWGDVEIPTEVTTIRDYAFANNSSITSIKLHDKVEITKSNETAFGMHSYAFKFLSNLKEITIDEKNNLYAIDEGTNILYLKENKTIIAGWGDVKIPENRISEIEGLTDICLRCFTSVTSCVIPSTITRIPAYAFQIQKLKH